MEGVHHNCLLVYFNDIGPYYLVSHRAPDFAGSALVRAIFSQGGWQRISRNAELQMPRLCMRFLFRWLIRVATLCDP